MRNRGTNTKIKGPKMNNKNAGVIKGDLSSGVICDLTITMYAEEANKIISAARDAVLGDMESILQYELPEVLIKNCAMFCILFGILLTCTVLYSACDN